jgi:hypothetical protein
MPGRAALMNIAEAKSDIRSTRDWENDTGVSGSDTSAIGNDGRMGASGHGMLDDPSYLRIDAEILGRPRAGLATTGEQGIGASGQEADWKSIRNAQGRIFSSGASKRKED